MKFFKKNWFSILATGIIVLSIFLRFVNYENRWGLAYDQAHDAIIARYALETFQIPLVGPFSSAGPFQTGGEWYWFIMAGTALFLPAVTTPWIVLTTLYVCFVLLIIRLGSQMFGRQFGLIVGLLAAVSTAQIAQSTNLTNQSPQAIVALLAIWSMYKYVMLRKSIFLLFLGFFASLAATIHLQGAMLIVLVIITLLFTKTFHPKKLIMLAVGLLIPLVPLIIFDLQNEFVNSEGFLQYYLYDQYKISYEALGRRWLTYITVFWPQSWAHIIGGNVFVAGLIIFMLFVATIINLRKKIATEWRIILVSFLGISLLTRYVRTPIFDSYLVFLHPFVLLLSGWAVYTLFKKHIILGLVLVVVVVVGSLYKDFSEIRNATNTAATRTKKIEQILANKLPGKKLALYDYKNSSVEKSYPVVLYLYSDNKIDDNGSKVGIRAATREATLRHPALFSDTSVDYQIIDLSNVAENELLKEGWKFINPSAVYESVAGWYK